MNENLEYNIHRNEVLDEYVLIIRDDKINRALKELKRDDKDLNRIIHDTIVILEEGMTINTKKIESMAEACGAALVEPLKVKPIPNTINMGQVILPDPKIDIRIDPCDPMSVVDQNRYMGGIK